MYKVFKQQDLEYVDYKVLDTKMSGAQVIKKYGADYALNATLYDVVSGKVITYSEDENKGVGYLFSKQGIGIKGDKSTIWTTYVQARKDDQVRDFIGGSPTLVVDGKVQVDAGTTDSWILRSKSYRSFLGIAGDKIYLGASDHTNTVEGLAEYCKAQGMTHAINLDGGGSCTLLEMKDGRVKYLVNQESRRNASWILVYLKGNKNAPNYKEDNRVETKQVKHCKILRTSKEGHKKQLEGIIIDGVSYAPVRPLGELLGESVGFEGGVVTLREK